MAHKQYGLIGYPLSHSFSIDFFNQKFDAEGIDAEYLNFEIEDVNMLMELIAEFPQLDGLNVTAPYKEEVIPFLDELGDDARRVGAVNVIEFVRNDHGQLKRLIGHNSDVVGFGKTMESLIKPGMKAMVLGTGGAAKAVKCALEPMGVPVQFVSRRKSSTTVTYEEITRNMVNEHTLIVNATPLGKYPDVDACPDFPFRLLTPKHLAYDLIYNPDVTLFMRHAQEAGAAIKNGLEMLLLQAFVSYEIWTGKRNAF